MTYRPRAWKKQSRPKPVMDEKDEGMAALIMKEKGLDVEPRIFRFRPSKDELRCGAWRWGMYLRGSNKQIGSPWKLSDILRAARRSYRDVRFGDVQIDVEKAYP